MGKYPKPNKAEQSRIEAMMQLGCCACLSLHIHYAAEECHHLLDGHKRMGHWFTIPLCMGHHRATWVPLQLKMLRPKERVAISDGRKAWGKAYPSEKNLWMLTQKRLGLPTVWPVSKILPRRIAGNQEPF